jgi:acyl-CoA dehydrogenase
MGHAGGGGHCEIRYENCRVPVANRLGPEHGGFMIAQARLGPGRIHHCMRAIGMAERGFEIMCRHANSRVAFGGPLGEKQFVQDWIATSRMEIDQARLLVPDDTPVAAMWREGRSLRIADGPDEVHKMVVARRELKRFA